VDTISEKSSLMLTPTASGGSTSEFTLYGGKEKEVWNQIVSRCTRTRDLDRPSSNWVHRRLRGLTPLSIQPLNLNTATESKTTMETKSSPEQGEELYVETDGAPPLETYPSSPS
jgi:hypothetical protein